MRMILAANIVLETVLLKYSTRIPLWVFSLAWYQTDSRVTAKSSQQFLTPVLAHLVFREFSCTSAKRTFSAEASPHKRYRTQSSLVFIPGRTDSSLLQGIQPQITQWCSRGWFRTDMGWISCTRFWAKTSPLGFWAANLMLVSCLRPERSSIH